MNKKRTKQEIKLILDNAMRHIKSVPYKVTLRWLFYRLFQDGTYHKKKDYITCKTLLAKARHNNIGEWRPDTLVDDTRQIHWEGIGAFNKEEWIESLKCNLDKFQNQDYFIMILFEANAMYSQFAYYTKNIPLVPFGGDPSIYYKWTIAKEIEWAYERYNKRIIILYFGDCDDKGRTIYSSSIKHIRKWCKVDFDVIYCGLTIEQAKAFKLPTDPFKPDKYQWEALTDEQSKKIILDNIKPFQKEERFEGIQKKEKEILKETKKLLEQQE